MGQKSSAKHSVIGFTLFILSIIGSSKVMGADKKNRDLILAPSCSQLFKSYPTWKWRQEDSLFRSLRANAGHFWEWSRDHARFFLPQKLLKFEGEIQGDDHTLNYGPIESEKNGFFWAFNDFDDSGRGPFVLALVLKLVRDQAQNIPQLGPMETLKSYRNGLRGKVMKTPEVIKKLESLTDKKMREKYKSFFQKKVNNDRFNLKDESDFQSIEDLPREDKIFLEKYGNEFERALLDIFPEGEILDQAFRVKTTGGSQGLVRYLFLMKSSRMGYRIFEFKPIVASSVEYYQPQENSIQRVERHMEMLWKGQQNSHYQIVKIGEDKVFYLRPRLPNYFKINDELKFDKLSNKEKREYLLYIANVNGQLVRDQFKSEKDLKMYIDLLGPHGKAFEIVSFVVNYLRVAKELNQN